MLPGDRLSALTPTAQEAGGQVSDLSHAMTAPGSPPPLFPDHNAQVYDAPVLAESPLNDRPNVVHGDDRPADPFGSPSGGGWNVAGDDAGMTSGGWRTP
jgi:hypothetical protein